MDSPADAPIGIFDSGIGGLSILAHIRSLLPNEHLMYVADQAHVPYGPRPLTEVRLFSQAISDFLLEAGAKLLVLACNTASAASLQHLRALFPQVPIVGMEPAVKPAALVTGTGHIGVLATPATFEGELFASVVARFAKGVQVHQTIAPGLVDRIEAGDLNGPETRQLLAQTLEPLLKYPIDTLVLGCTHYPFILPLLNELVDGVQVIDPSPAIARRVQTLLVDGGLESSNPAPGRTTYITTGEAGRYRSQIDDLIGIPGEVLTARWSGEKLQFAGG